MEITIIVNPQSSILIIPINLIFWGFIITYAFHILEESILGEIFVEKMKRLYWKEYDWRKFAGFNTFLMLLNICAVVLFECFGGAWLIFPLGLAIERFLNGFYHLFESIKTKRLSSGLLTSIIFLILGYFLIKYSIITGEIASNYLLVSFIVGVGMEFIISGFMIITPLRQKIIRLATTKK